MKTKYETIKFDTDQKEIVVALIEQHVAGVNSLFWLNVEPDVHGKDIHTGSIFWKAFSSRGPVIPKFTWVSASTSKSGNYQPAQLGLTHPTGNAVLQRLRDFNLTVSDDWMLQQDHPKRGLVFQLPREYDAGKVIDFGLSAIPVLSPFECDNKFCLHYPMK